MISNLRIGRARRLPAVPKFAPLVAALLLFVAACSDGDDAGPPEPAPATPLATRVAAAAATAAPTTAPTAAPTGTATAAPTAAPTVALTERAAAAPTPVTVTDSEGFTLSFERPPGRIISLSPGATEILFAIGAGDQVVGADQFSDYPPETEQLERVAYRDPDPEQVLALEPDLVLLATAQEPSVEHFRSLGLTVLFNGAPESLEGVLENVILLGQVTGQDSAAEQLAAEMRARIAYIAERLSGVEDGPRVFYELTSDLYSAAPESFIGGTLTLLKAQNIAAGALTPFPQLTAEALIDSNPEVILLADGVWGESLETVAARPGWDAVQAVREGRVYPVDPDTGNRPGPRIVDAIEEIAALLYPELFP